MKNTVKPTIKIMSENKTDQMVLELLKKVEEKKKQIGNAERPSWATNCSFRYNPSVNDAVNIQTAGLETLVNIHAFLSTNYKAYLESLQALKLTEKEVAFGDYGDGRYAWFTESVERWALPTQAVGHLGFWEW